LIDMDWNRLLAFAGENQFAAIGLVGLTLAIVYTEISRLFSGFKAVDPAGLTALINRQDALLVDVSALADFEKGHIAGAKHVLMSQFDADNKVLAKVRELPVALACRTGATSAEAARKLAKAGFKQVYWLDGGIAAWQQANLPLVKGKA
jgi:rhodanese-related sulfurtransferase